MHVLMKRAIMFPKGAVEAAIKADQNRRTDMGNEYDNEKFFEEYAKMPRSRDGLGSAGEWHQLKPLFPPLRGKKVLDLGCGYGWHCKYAAEQGAVFWGVMW